MSLSGVGVASDFKFMTNTQMGFVLLLQRLHFRRTCVKQYLDTDLVAGHHAVTNTYTTLIKVI